METTELIENVVLAHFREASVPYDVVGRNAVAVRASTMEFGELNVLISGKELSKAPMLVATIGGIATFPAERALTALRLCNELNRAAVGIFFVNEVGGIIYRLIWHAASRNPDEVGTLLTRAIATIDKFYPAIMSVWWEAVRDKRALERLEGDEEDGGGADSDILSDDIRRILDRRLADGDGEPDRRRIETGNRRTALRSSELGDLRVATELMERLVMPALDANSVKYSVTHDFAVSVQYMTESAGSVEIYIIDRQTDDPLIEFRSMHVTKFPSDRADYASTICNRLNAIAPGKFLVDEIGDMEYRLEWHIQDGGAQADDVMRMLDTALLSVVRFYPAIMKARWADAEIDDALESADDALALESADSGGGEPPDIMSDDDIRRLLDGVELDEGDAPE